MLTKCDQFWSLNVFSSENHYVNFMLLGSAWSCQPSKRNLRNLSFREILGKILIGNWLLVLLKLVSLVQCRTIIIVKVIP